MEQAMTDFKIPSDGAVLVTKNRKVKPDEKVIKPIFNWYERWQNRKILSDKYKEAKRILKTLEKKS